MVSFPAHKSIRLITDNAKAKEQYKALGLQPKRICKNPFRRTGTGCMDDQTRKL